MRARFVFSFALCQNAHSQCIPKERPARVSFAQRVSPSLLTTLGFISRGQLTVCGHFFASHGQLTGRILRSADRGGHLTLSFLTVALRRAVICPSLPSRPLQNITIFARSLFYSKMKWPRMFTKSVMMNTSKKSFYQLTF